jgi:hypothetical protein
MGLLILGAGAVWFAIGWYNFNHGVNNDLPNGFPSLKKAQAIILVQSETAVIQTLHIITVHSSPEGVGILAYGGGSFSIGKMIDIGISGYPSACTFLYWTKDGAHWSDAMRFQYTVDGDHDFEAHFECPSQLVTTISSPLVTSMTTITDTRLWRDINVAFSLDNPSPYAVYSLKYGNFGTWSKLGTTPSVMVILLDGTGEFASDVRRGIQRWFDVFPDVIPFHPIFHISGVNATGDEDLIVQLDATTFPADKVGVAYSSCSSDQYIFTRIHVPEDCSYCSSLWSQYESNVTYEYAMCEKRTARITLYLAPVRAYIEGWYAPVDWFLGYSQDLHKYMTQLAKHEFGHILGLDHAWNLMNGKPAHPDDEFTNLEKHALQHIFEHWGKDDYIFGEVRVENITVIATTFP